MKENTREHLATLASNILNPFLIALAMIVVLAIQSTTSILSALRWSAVVAVISIGPILLIVAYLVRRGRLSSLLSAIRQQRTEVYLMAGAVIVLDYVILRWINAPGLLVTGISSGMPMVILFMCINFFWKISVHAATMSALVVVLVILFGWLALISVLLLVAVSWARVVLKEHTAAQVIAGAVVSAVTVAVSFHFGGVF